MGDLEVLDKKNQLAMIIKKNQKDLKTLILVFFNKVMTDTIKYKYDNNKMILSSKGIMISFNSDGFIKGIWIGDGLKIIPIDHMDSVRNSFKEQLQIFLRYYSNKKELEVINKKLQEEIYFAKNLNTLT